MYEIFARVYKRFFQSRTNPSEVLGAVDVVNQEKQKVEAQKLLKLLLFFIHPKPAGSSSENKSKNSSSSFVEVTVAKIGNVFLAHPTSHVPALNAINFVAAIKLLQRDLTGCTPCVLCFIELKLIKIDIFALLFGVFTVSARMEDAFTFETHFCGTTRTNSLIFTTTARLFHYCVAVSCRAPHFLFVQCDSSVSVKDLVLLQNIWMAQFFYLLLTVSCLFYTIHAHTRKSSSHALCYV